MSEKPPWRGKPDSATKKDNNAIFFGAPGTGKTATVKKICIEADECPLILSASKDLELDINDFDLGGLNPQAESSTQTNNSTGFLTRQFKRQLSLSAETQEKSKAIKLKETQSNWTTLHPSFTSQLIQLWQNHNFTPAQAQEWINTNPPSKQNQASQEPAFYTWLRDTKNLTPEQVLNHSDLNALKQEYQTTQQQAHTLPLP